MSRAEEGVQRTSRRKTLGVLLVGALATLIAAGGVVANPQPTQASSKKVVIVVGATGSTTSSYRSIGRSLARQARSYGARVIEVYSPHATWARVKTAAYHANLLVYLGHGNGWPSPYAPFQTRTKDGMGLNSALTGSDYNTEYYGERFLDTNLHLARNSVVRRATPSGAVPSRGCPRPRPASTTTAQASCAPVRRQSSQRDSGAASTCCTGSSRPTGA
jgi:hypothetical protein